jgi:hypothetical protein
VSVWHARSVRGGGALVAAGGAQVQHLAAAVGVEERHRIDSIAVGIRGIGASIRQYPIPR